MTEKSTYDIEIGDSGFKITQHIPDKLYEYHYFTRWADAAAWLEKEMGLAAPAELFTKDEREREIKSWRDAPRPAGGADI